MSKAVTAIEKKIAENEAKINKLLAEKKKLEQELSNANGRKKFTFPTGETYPFNDMIVVRHYYIETGLGYSEDKILFGEYKLRHRDINYDVRVLSRAECERLGIPIDVNRRHQMSEEFESRFGGVAEEIHNETPWQEKRDFKNI
ncbi:hypothetical protein phiOC_p122 [Ochrobactrum phage vB_OspM_OC]|nr:hypothetical protein phiOC_p122 [Ochrobactrum phage vB_OspM_OC]